MQEKKFQQIIFLLAGVSDCVELVVIETVGAVGGWTCATAWGRTRPADPARLVPV